MSLLAAFKPSLIAGIALKPVVNGAINGPAINSELLWDCPEPVILFIVRRPGCPGCREHARDLCERQKAGEFLGAKLIGVIKEIAPTKNVKTDEELGVKDFQTTYFENNPVYYDEQNSFYKILGSRSLLSQKLHSWNPFTLYSDYKKMNKRFEAKKVAGNLKGEGIIQGGIFIVSKSQDIIYQIHEVTGSELPYDEIKKAVHDLSASGEQVKESKTEAEPTA